MAKAIPKERRSCPEKEQEVQIRRVSCQSRARRRQSEKVARQSPVWMEHPARSDSDCAVENGVQKGSSCHLWFCFILHTVLKNEMQTQKPGSADVAEGMPLHMTLPAR